MSRAGMLCAGFIITASLAIGLTRLQAADTSDGNPPRPPVRTLESLGRDWLGKETVAKELDLSDAQKLALKKIDDERRRQLTLLRASLASVPSEDWLAKLHDVESKIEKNREAVLDVKQRARLQEIEVQAGGLRALLSKEISETLQLTDEQIDELIGFGRARQKAFLAALKSPERDGYVDIGKSVSTGNDLNKTLRDVLTAEQFATFEKLEGKKFDVEAMYAQSAQDTAAKPAPRSWNRRTIAYMDVSLLRRAAVVAELNVTAEQAARLKKLDEEGRKQISGIGDSLHDASHGETLAKTHDATDALAKKLDAVLTERQLARLQELRIQTREEEALLYREVGEALKLSDKQVHELADIRDTRVKALIAARSIIIDSRSSVELMLAIHHAATANMRNVLTPIQRDAFEQMKGKTFNPVSRFSPAARNGATKPGQKSERESKDSN